MGGNLIPPLLAAGNICLVLPDIFLVLPETSERLSAFVFLQPLLLLSAAVDAGAVVDQLMAVCLHAAARMCLAHALLHIIYAAYSTHISHHNTACPTLVITVCIAVRAGYIFGAYTPDSWRINPRFFGSGETFIFQLQVGCMVDAWCMVWCMGYRRNASVSMTICCEPVSV